MSEPTPDLTEAEAILAGLAPAPPAALSRDRLVFEAGRRSVPRSRAWPAATVAFAGLAAVLGAKELTRPEPSPQVVERIVYLPAPPQSLGEVAVSPSPPPEVRPFPRSSAPDEGTDYLALRDRVLRDGIDALPQLAPVSARSFVEPTRAFSLRGGTRVLTVTP